MSGLRGQILSYTAGNVSAQVATTLVGIYLARTLALHDLGSYRQVILVVTVAGQVLALGLPLSIFYFLSRFETKEEQIRFAGQTLLLLSGVGAVASLLLILAAPFIADRFDNPDLVRLLRVGSPLLFTGLAIKYLGPTFLSLGRSQLAGILRVVQAFSVSLVLVVLVAIGQPLGEALLGMAAAEAVAILVGLRLQARDLAIRPSLDRPLLRMQLAYALPLGMSSVVGLLSRQIDQFMVADFFDTETYALYSTGALEFPLVPLLMTSAAGVILPQLAKRFAAGDHGGYQDLFARAQGQLGLVVFAILGLVFALGEILIVGLYGERFDPSTPVFRIYALNSLNRLFLFGVLLQSTGRSRLVLVGESSFLVLNTLGNWYFLRWIGFLGPAIATYVAGLALMVFYTWQAGRIGDFERRRLYDVGRNLRLLVAAGGAAAATMWVTQWLPRNLLMLVAGSGIYVGFFLPAVLVVRAVPRDELTALLPWNWRRVA